jgi:hypothetical protein
MSESITESATESTPADSTTPLCDVCEQPADFEVQLSDDIPHYGLFDETSGHVCFEHAIENEAGAVGIRAHASYIGYPYFKDSSTTGFLKYRSLKTGRLLKLRNFEYPTLKRNSTRKATPSR